MTVLKTKNKRIMDIETGEVTEITELLVTKTDID